MPGAPAPPAKSKNMVRCQSVGPWSEGFWIAKHCVDGLWVHHGVIDSVYIWAVGAYRALCARCAKSWLFSTTGSSVSSED